MGYCKVPATELEQCYQQIIQKPWLSDHEWILKKYRESTRFVIDNPFDAKATELILEALTDRRPYSVIRIGEGEVSLLSYLAYRETPNANFAIATASIARRKDRFDPNPHWLVRLSKMTHRAVYTADIIGVRGFWPFWPRQPGGLMFTKHAHEVRKGQDLRSFLGPWRAVDHMLSMATSGLLSSQIIAPHHLYFGVAKHLEVLLRSANSVIMMCQHKDIVDALSEQFPGVTFSFVPVGKMHSDTLPTRPSFLFSTIAALPTNLSGTLVLIAAGIWAEWYALKVKQRGGVAVDLGSGLDLLRGECTRPIHLRVSESFRRSLNRLTAEH